MTDHNSPSPELVKLRKLVRQCAIDTIKPLYQRTARHFKSDGSVVTEADHASHRWLKRELSAQWPAVAFLSEEMKTTRQEKALAQTGFWCVDPLDGTSNFAAGIPFFCVSVALVDGDGPRLGVVYDPNRDELFSAERGRGAWLGDERMQPVEAPPLNRCIAAADYKRLTPELRHHLAVDHPYGSQRNFGACALEWSWLAAGRYQLYLHGGQKFWDYAAGSLILEQAGGKACTLDGETIFDGSLSSRSAIATLDPQRFDEWRAALAL